jgi:O-antigen/teichoic acid export membrane protein
MVLILLAFAAVGEVFNSMLGQPLIAAHKMWHRFAFDVVLVAVLVGVAWLLVPKWGALGLAAAYGLAYVVTTSGLATFGRSAAFA